MTKGHPPMHYALVARTPRGEWQSFPLSGSLASIGIVVPNRRWVRGCVAGPLGDSL